MALGRRLAVGVALVALAWASRVTARAQAPDASEPQEEASESADETEDGTAGRPSPEAVDRARALFDEGSAAFDAGDYEVALERFRAAHALTDRAGLRFNIGICLERLGRFREAAEEYGEAALSEQLTGPIQSRARDLNTLARANLGVLVVEGEPEGSGVLVDGALLCQLPCRVELDPGPHRVVVVGTHGGRSRPRTVELERARTAELYIIAHPPGTPAPPEFEARGPGWATWLGTAVAAAGAAGIAAFGLRAAQLEDEYRLLPNRSVREEGQQMRLLTNVSIVVAGVGAVFALVDLLFFAPRQEMVEPTPERNGEEVEASEARVSLGLDGLRIAF